MRFLVVSDTHRQIDKVIEIYKFENQKQQIDAIIHLGDHIDDALNIQEELDCKLYAVPGNCDFSSEKTHKIIETEAGNILLTHGHKEGVKSSFLRLLYKAEEMDCVAVLFGHTHIPTLSQEGSLYLINPGSISQPADYSEGSYAILSTDDDEISATILYYSKDLIKNNASSEPEDNNKGSNNSDKTTSQKKNVQGGYLKSLLNYSDRF